ncbi:hypothetical protein KIPB_002560, partial [Kipferlia bialata]
MKDQNYAMMRGSMHIVSFDLSDSVGGICGSIHQSARVLKKWESAPVQLDGPVSSGTLCSTVVVGCTNGEAEGEGEGESTLDIACLLQNRESGEEGLGASIALSLLRVSVTTARGREREGVSLSVSRLSTFRGLPPLCGGRERERLILERLSPYPHSHPVKGKAGEKERERETLLTVGTPTLGHTVISLSPSLCDSGRCAFRSLNQGYHHALPTSRAFESSGASHVGASHHGVVSLSTTERGSCQLVRQSLLSHIVSPSTPSSGVGEAPFGHTSLLLTTLIEGERERERVACAALGKETGIVAVVVALPSGGRELHIYSPSQFSSCRGRGGERDACVRALGCGLRYLSVSVDACKVVERGHMLSLSLCTSVGLERQTVFVCKGVVGERQTAEKSNAPSLLDSLSLSLSDTMALPNHSFLSLSPSASKEEREREISGESAGKESERESARIVSALDGVAGVARRFFGSVLDQPGLDHSGIDRKAGGHIPSASVLLLGLLANLEVTSPLSLSLPPSLRKKQRDRERVSEAGSDLKKAAKDTISRLISANPDAFYTLLLTSLSPCEGERERDSAEKERERERDLLQHAIQSLFLSHNTHRSKCPDCLCLPLMAMGKERQLGALYKANDQGKLGSFLTDRVFVPKEGVPAAVIRKNQVAASKNAYVLLGKGEWERAAAWFMLAGNISDALNLMVKHKRVSLAVSVFRMHFLHRIDLDSSNKGLEGEREGEEDLLDTIQAVQNSLSQYIRRQTVEREREREREAGLQLLDIVALGLRKRLTEKRGRESGKERERERSRRESVALVHDMARTLLPVETLGRSDAEAAEGERVCEREGQGERVGVEDTLCGALSAISLVRHMRTEGERDREGERENTHTHRAQRERERERERERVQKSVMAPVTAALTQLYSALDRLGDYVGPDVTTRSLTRSLTAVTSGLVRMGQKKSVLSGLFLALPVESTVRATPLRQGESGGGRERAKKGFNLMGQGSQGSGRLGGFPSSPAPQQDPMAAFGGFGMRNVPQPKPQPQADPMSAFGGFGMRNVPQPQPAADPMAAFGGFGMRNVPQPKPQPAADPMAAFGGFGMRNVPRPQTQTHAPSVLSPAQREREREILARERERLSLTHPLTESVHKRTEECLSILQARLTSMSPAPTDAKTDSIKGAVGERERVVEALKGLHLEELLGVRRGREGAAKRESDSMSLAGQSLGPIFRVCQVLGDMGLVDKVNLGVSVNDETALVMLIQSLTMTREQERERERERESGRSGTSSSLSSLSLSPSLSMDEAKAAVQSQMLLRSCLSSPLAGSSVAMLLCFIRVLCTSLLVGQAHQNGNEARYEALLSLQTSFMDRLESHVMSQIRDYSSRQRILGRYQRSSQGLWESGGDEDTLSLLTVMLLLHDRESLHREIDHGERERARERERRRQREEEIQERERSYAKADQEESEESETDSESSGDMMRDEREREKQREREARAEKEREKESAREERERKREIADHFVQSVYEASVNFCHRGFILDEQTSILQRLDAHSPVYDLLCNLLDNSLHMERERETERERERLHSVARICWLIGEVGRVKLFETSLVDGHPRINHLERGLAMQVAASCASVLSMQQLTSLDDKEPITFIRALSVPVPLSLQSGEEPCSPATPYPGSPSLAPSTDIHDTMQVVVIATPYRVVECVLANSIGDKAASNLESFSYYDSACPTPKPYAMSNLHGSMTNLHGSMSNLHGSMHGSINLSAVYSELSETGSTKGKRDRRSDKRPTSVAGVKANGRLLPVLERPNVQATCLCTSTASDCYALASGSSVFLLKPGVEDPVHSFTLPDDTIPTSICFNTAGSVLCIGGNDGSVSVLSLDTPHSLPRGIFTSHSHRSGLASTHPASHSAAPSRHGRERERDREKEREREEAEGEHRFIKHLVMTDDCIYAANKSHLYVLKIRVSKQRSSWVKLYPFGSQAHSHANISGLRVVDEMTIRDSVSHSHSLTSHDLLVGSSKGDIAVYRGVDKILSFSGEG